MSAAILKATSCITVTREGRDIELIVEGTIPSSSIPNVIHGPHDVAHMARDVDLSTRVVYDRPGAISHWMGDLTDAEETEACLHIAEAVLEDLRGER